jgi:hypothetical protein
MTLQSDSVVPDSGDRARFGADLKATRLCYCALKTAQFESIRPKPGEAGNH